MTCCARLNPIVLPSTAAFHTATVHADKSVETDIESIGVPVEFPSCEAYQDSPWCYVITKLVADFLVVQLDELKYTN